MGDRVGSISGIMIAFVALIPTIRENIPPSPRIVFIEILVYLNTLTSVFVLVDSLIVRDLGDYQFQWRESGLFLVSAIITVLSFLIIIVMMFLHYFVWKKSYKTNKTENSGSFRRDDWSN